MNNNFGLSDNFNFNIPDNIGMTIKKPAKTPLWIKILVITLIAISLVQVYYIYRKYHQKPIVEKKYKTEYVESDSE